MNQRISGFQSQSQYQYKSAFEKMASGRKINRSADGAAQLAIAQKIIAEYRGQDVGTRNMATGQDVLNISEAAASGVNDYLQRINELSIQASNDTLTGSDRDSIQMEIDQLKQGIQDIADQTQFNGMKLLDGSRVSGLQIAADGNSSVRINQSVDLGLEALGIKDYDVTKSGFDLNTISKAMEKVNSSRTQMGAETNRLQHGINYSTNASINQQASESRLMDTDYGAGSYELKKQQTLRTYSLQMQRNQMQNYSRQMQNFML